MTESWVGPKNGKPSNFFEKKKWRNLIKMTIFGDLNDDFDDFDGAFLVLRAILAFMNF